MSSVDKRPWWLSNYKETLNLKMVRVTTQETFDSVVQENEEDLGMEHDEAVQDAIKQFEAAVCTYFIITEYVEHVCMVILILSYFHRE